MSKTDWTTIQTLYVADMSLSYSKLAKRFRTATSTIQRRATREDWPRLREKFQEKKARKLMKLTLEKQVEADARHIKTLHMTQDYISYQLNVHFHTVQSRELSLRELTRQGILIKSLTTAIMGERTILGLPTKPIRITDPEQINAYQVIMGYADEPYESPRKKLDETIDTLDRYIEHRQTLERLRNEGIENGEF